MRFLCLTEYESGRRFYVNADQIVTVAQREGFTFIQFVNGGITVAQDATAIVEWSGGLLNR